MNQLGLFADDEPDAEGMSEARLRGLLGMWRVSLDDADALQRVLAEIKIETGKLKQHPHWWVLPVCECEECRGFQTDEEKQ